MIDKNLGTGGNIQLSTVPKPGWEVGGVEKDGGKGFLVNVIFDLSFEVSEFFISEKPIFPRLRN